MANSLNSNPIIIDTDLTSSWRQQQTLNTGNFPTTVQQPVTTFRQPGINVTKIKVVVNNAVGAASTLSITDPIDSTVLYPPVLIGATTQVLGTQVYSDIFDQSPLQWRDFKVTGVTAAKVTVFIWYRD